MSHVWNGHVVTTNKKKKQQRRRPPETNLLGQLKMVFELCWVILNYFGIILGSCRGHVRIISESCWNDLRVMLGWFGIILESS